MEIGDVCYTYHNKNSTNVKYFLEMPLAAFRLPASTSVICYERFIGEKESNKPQEEGFA